MARPKAFDRDVALERAMHVFWARGYEATSLDDLLREMNIGRQSLYDTFGDKRALFLEALARYRQLLDGFVAGCLAGQPSVKAGIRQLFDGVVADSEDRKRRGCLLVNTAIELAPHDPEAARLVNAGQLATERAFERALQLARRRGELANGKRIRPLARFLVGALLGMRVVAKADPDPRRLRDMADVALQALD